MHSVELSVSCIWRCAMEKAKATHTCRCESQATVWNQTKGAYSCLACLCVPVIGAFTTFLPAFCNHYRLQRLALNIVAFLKLLLLLSFSLRSKMHRFTIDCEMLAHMERSQWPDWFPTPSHIINFKCLRVILLLIIISVDVLYFSRFLRHIHRRTHTHAHNAPSFTCIQFMVEPFRFGFMSHACTYHSIIVDEVCATSDAWLRGAQLLTICCRMVIYFIKCLCSGEKRKIQEMKEKNNKAINGNNHLLLACAQTPTAANGINL